ALPGLPADGRRAGDPHRVPARRARRSDARPDHPRLDDNPGGVMTEPDEMVNVRYMVDDVSAAIDFYTSYLGFELRTNAVPAFADVTRGNLRLLLSGPASSAGRPMPDGTTPGPG